MIDPFNLAEEKKETKELTLSQQRALLGRRSIYLNGLRSDSGTATIGNLRYRNTYIGETVTRIKSQGYKTTKKMLSQGMYACNSCGDLNSIDDATCSSCGESKFIVVR